MTGKVAPKYIDVDPPDKLELRQLAVDHLAGRRTIAVSLADDQGRARSGCRDYDGGGEALLRAALAADARRGIVSFGVLVGERSHLWRLYAQPCDAHAIRADLHATLPPGPGECYPSRSVIRLPFGYHRLARTRGVLITQDGRRFDLDDEAQREAAIEFVLTIRRNPPPAPARSAGRERALADAAGDAPGASPDWGALPDGWAIWRSARVRALARHRPQLAALLRGERVTLMRQGAPDDSDSAQVAALVFNLLGANFPECEVRAVAWTLRTRLRPGKSSDAYRAQIDVEIARYRPRNYKPQPTRIGAAATASPAARRMHERAAIPVRKPFPYPPQAGETKGTRTRGRRARLTPEAYFAWLDQQATGGVVLMSQHECAARLSVSLSTVKRLERTLRAGGHIERHTLPGRQAGYIRLTRGFIIPPEASATAGGDVGSEILAAPRQDAPERGVGGRNELTHAPDPPVVHSPPTPTHARDAGLDLAALAAADATLAELVDAAFDLAADAPQRARRRVVRGLIEAVTGRVDDAAFARAYRAAIDRRRLAALDLRQLRREARKRLRLAERLRVQAERTGVGVAQAWATAYAAQRAHRVLEARTGVRQADDGPGGRMTPGERRQVATLRTQSLAARDGRARQAHLAGLLDVAVYGPARGVTPALRGALRDTGTPAPAGGQGAGVCSLSPTASAAQRIEAMLRSDPRLIDWRIERCNGDADPDPQGDHVLITAPDGRWQFLSLADCALVERTARQFVASYPPPSPVASAATPARRSERADALIARLRARLEQNEQEGRNDVEQ